MNPYNNDNTNDSNISSNSLDNITSRVRKRDRLKSLVQSGTSAIKQEINKRYNEYYYTSSSKSISLRSLSSSQTSFTDLHTNNSSSSLYHQVDENSNVNDNKIQRTETQKAVDEILPEDVRLSETVQSQCLLFPTYACQLVDSKDNATIRYKTVLAGWAFTKPSSTSRLDRFLRGKILA
ncbi:uncharacterized protein BX663DRAFT_503116 [Cokeromyces recurvatus]|uniref:uncharacterized protein n=1 Tax=Cokeromyces recurvatus TaxID=90255 RepID=UPI0022209F51|nr:uncharacterized protein BX663DRAFT_503116 [Cokeromyces recurvatus]KAI7904661.1 hypothetical protein BX663DRAFT_503116 [Cokeromyces recurvatus]